MNAQTYSILSPVMGLRKDVPGILLQEAYNQDSENIIFVAGEVHRVKMPLEELSGTETTDGKTIIHYHTLVTSAGSTYLLAFTESHIYYWNTATKVYDEVFAGTTTDHWESISYADKVIATNGEDKVQVWTPGGSFAPLDTASGLDLGGAVYCTSAKHITVYANFIIIADTYEGGTRYPQRIRWCSIGAMVNWDGGNSGAADIGGSDFITAFGSYQSNLIIFKTGSLYRLWLTGATTVFSVVAISKEIGCIAPDSVVNDGIGHLMYYASDNTFKAFPLTDISLPIYTEAKQFMPLLISKIRAKYMQHNNEIWWSVPYEDGTSPTENNKIFVFKDNYWSIVGIAIQAFGSWDRQSVYTWDTLPDIFASWEKWGWDKWDTIVGSEGAPLDLAATGTKTYSLHESEGSHEGYIVLSTDLQSKQGIPFYKRILEFETYFQKETSGTATIELKRDGETSWQTAGTVDLTTGNEDIVKTSIPCDFRAKTFLLKVKASNRFRFLGMFVRFVQSGKER